MNRQSPKIAIVCDFLCTMGGAENVVLALHEAFPEAPIYTAIYEESKVPALGHLIYKSCLIYCVNITNFFPHLQLRQCALSI